MSKQLVVVWRVLALIDVALLFAANGKQHDQLYIATSTFQSTEHQSVLAGAQLGMTQGVGNEPEGDYLRCQIGNGWLFGVIPFLIPCLSKQPVKCCFLLFEH